MTSGLHHSGPVATLRIVALTILMVAVPVRESYGQSFQDLERAALVALYDALGGTSWTDATNWNSAHPVGTWYGISTNQFNISGVNVDLVVGINLQANNLAGVFPAALATAIRDNNVFGQLQILDLSTNAISGSLLSELGMLHSLTALLLSENDFSGTIPVGLTDNTGLITLHLFNNNLTGGIPAEIGLISSLQELDLGFNMLNGGIPSEIAMLTNLNNLQLGSNQLTGSIPSEIGNLSALQKFDISQNQIGGTLPSELGALSNLTQLVFHSNMIGGLIPASYGNLTSLQQLILSDNQLTGTLVTDYSGMVNLQWVALDNNLFTAPLQPAMGALTGLQIFHVENNSISGEIPLEFGNMTSLRTLILTGNNLSGAVPTELVAINTLQLLELGSNQLTGLPSFDGHPSLTRLWVENNLLTFEDLESNVDIANFTYSPQGSFGEKSTLNLTEGDLLTLSFSVGGESNLYQWSVNELPIADATSATYTKVATLADAGEYELSVTNSIVTGLELLSAEITVNVAPALVPDISASPLTFDFGSVGLGAPTTTSINISNTGTGPGEVSISIVDDPSGSFSQNEADQTIEAGTNKDITVTFDPQIRGALSGRLRVVVTDPAQKTASSRLVASGETIDVTLSGSGISPLIAPDVTSVDFEPLAIGSTALSNVIITNSGELPLTFVTVIGGSDPGSYSVSPGNGTVEPGLTATLQLSFSPSTLGLLSASLHISNNSPNTQVDIPLSGTGVEPAIELSLSEMDALAALYDAMNGDNWTNNTNWLSESTPDTWYGITVEEPAAGKSGLVQVTEIDLSSNNLVGGFPAGWSTNISDGAFAGLRILRLSNNSISGEIFPEIGNLSSLNILMLNDNNLTGAIPPSLIDLAPTLHELSLGGNSFAGPFPLDLILALTNLKFLTLADLGLTGDIPDLSAHTSLRELHLENNAFTGPLPVWLGTLTNLESLWLSDNQFSGSVPSELGNLAQLQVLQLFSNQFDGELPDALTSLAALRTLLVSDNGFTGLPDFSGTRSLTRLEVDNNSLTFEDLEANVGIRTFVYAPQADIGTTRSETVTEGDNLGGALSLEVGGVNNQYQWFRNDLVIEGANMPTYDSAAALSDAGDWILRVTNSTLPELTLSSRAISLRVERAPLLISPASFDFGDVNVGDFSTMTIQFINPGAASVDFDLSLVNNVADAFTASTASVVMDPFSTINIQIDFTPVSRGSATATLHVESPDPVTSFDVPLSGNGTAAVMGLSSTSFSFGAVVVGIGSLELLTVSNTGELPLNFDVSLSAAAGPGFSVSPTSGSILSGSNMTLTVAFSPTSAGAQSGSLELTSNDPDSPLSVDLAGSGVIFGIIAPETQTLNPETGTGLEITVEIIEAAPDSGTLFYRRTGESGYAQTAFVIGTTSASATIPTEFVTERGLDYYSVFVAGSLSVSIPAVSEPSLFPVHLPVSVPFLEAQGAFIPDEYHMVSVPLLLQDPRIESVLKAFGTYDPVRWRILHWNPQTAVYDEFPNLPAGFAPCQAYWLITQQGQRFTVENGSSVAPQNPCDVVARPGWNQISVPYSFAVRWEDVGGSELLEAPVAYDPAAVQTDPYQYNQTILQPWNGYWINNRTDNDVPLVFSPVEAAGKTSKNGASTIDRALTYSVQLTASIAHLGLVDSNNLVGFSALATDEYDQIDYAEAPPIGSFVRLSLLDGDQRLAGDFKPPSEEGKSWTLEIDAALGKRALKEDEYVQVQLEDQGQLPENFNVYVFDEDLRERIPIAENRFGVYLSRELAQRRLRLVIGTPAFARDAGGGIPLLPVKVALEQNFPNPFSGSTHIRYQIQESQEVVLQVFDLLGRLVTTLQRSEQTAGWYDITWDGRDDSGAKVASGMYVYKLSTGSTVQIRSMIRVK